jgi:peroxiredoxin
MVYQFVEHGPIVNSTVPEFQLPNHNNTVVPFNDLIGKNGAIFGFIGDIWQPTSVRRILWLQRNVGKFALMGTPVSLLIRDHPHTLFGFYSSSPLPVPFPLLADTDGRVHQIYNMERQAGLLLVDRQRIVREKWLMPAEYVWPKFTDLMQAIQRLV